MMSLLKKYFDIVDNVLNDRIHFFECKKEA